jgi:chloramphenicol 3-O-phosphotransferase
MTSEPNSAPSAQSAKPATMEEAEKYASRRAARFLSDDAKQVCAADVTRPFANLQDAIDRLLPFHVRPVFTVDLGNGEFTSGHVRRCWGV